MGSITLPSQWFIAPARLYAYQPLLLTAQKEGSQSKKRALYSARENSIGVITDIQTHE
jgi:hypothetical protein